MPRALQRLQSMEGRKKKDKRGPGKGPERNARDRAACIDGDLEV